MKIGIWSDSVNFPNLPLMKLSTYHKELGDSVEFIEEGGGVTTEFISARFSIYLLSLKFQKVLLNSYQARRLKGELVMRYKWKTVKKFFTKNCIAICQRKSNTFTRIILYTRNSKTLLTGF